MATLSATPIQFQRTPTKKRRARGTSGIGRLSSRVSDNYLKSSALIEQVIMMIADESDRSYSAGVRRDRCHVRAHEPAVVRRGVVCQPRAESDHERQFLHIGAGPVGLF